VLWGESALATQEERRNPSVLQKPPFGCLGGGLCSSKSGFDGPRKGRCGPKAVFGCPSAPFGPYGRDFRPRTGWPCVSETDSYRRKRPLDMPGGGFGQPGACPEVSWGSLGTTPFSATYCAAASWNRSEAEIDSTQCCPKGEQSESMRWQRPERARHRSRAFNLNAEMKNLHATFAKPQRREI